MRTIAIMLALLTLACCTEAVAMQQPAGVKKNTTTQNPNLYGLPIIITFPDLPAVPDKIKAPKPSEEAGAALRNIPAYTPTPTSDGPDAAKSR